ncbi:hypothetical protein K3495_g7710 [Podosphaera aphanis]|nr:hypothetical protein K3495_g7710 [Podosphaera aphanis]
MDGAHLNPVAYTSRKLNPTQQRYSSQEREALGIVQALQTWQEWIEGCDIIIRTDHESLPSIRKKSNLPRRMQRFVGILEHFDPTIVFRRGKSNHLADWLSRPPSVVSSFPISGYDPVHENFSKTSVKNPDPERLNWIDLHAIGEFLQHGVALPSNLPESWVKNNFTSHNKQTFRVMDGKFLKIHHYDKLVIKLINLHENLAHCPIGTLIRESRRNLWHPDIVLAAQEAFKTCPRCQLMTKPVNIHDQGTLHPVQAPMPFTRWGIDHTGPVQHNDQSAYLCTAIDHGTSYAMALLTRSPNTSSCVELTRQIYVLFGLKQLITDNGQAFLSGEMSSFCKEREIEQRITKPYRPQTNGKVERFNGIIKTIFHAISSINQKRSMQWVLDQTLSTYNRRPNLTGYAPIFLALGISQEFSPSPYIRELTRAEEIAFASDIVNIYSPKTQYARLNVANGKAARDEIRSYLQEEKARLRTFGKGDWVLRQRKRDHKGEPYYDGPFVIAETNPSNGYILRTPGGVILQNQYHGQQLFPAYVRDGHPVRSLWYGSKTLLDKDRRRTAAMVEPWNQADKEPESKVYRRFTKAHRPPLDLFVFSDEALIEDRAGAGYSKYRGLTQKVGQGSLPLGSSAEVYDAEVAGATAGLSAALTNPMAYYATNVTVCLDNQEAALRLIDTPTTSSPRIALFRELASSWTQRSRSQNTLPGSVNVRWCPGHVGIPGNEIADALAKSACTTQSPILPTSIARAKRDVKARYQSHVSAYWQENAPTRYKDLGINLNAKISPELASLDRRTIGLLIAARTRHGDFADYHRRFHHEDALLECTCREEKTLDHFFFCQLGRLRARLDGPRHPATGIRWILGSKDGALAFGK